MTYSDPAVRAPQAVADEADVQWIRDAAHAEMARHKANGCLHLAAKVRGQVSRALAGIRRDTEQVVTDESAVVRARAQLAVPGADQNIQIVGDEPPRALADRVVAAVQARMEHDDATYDVIYPSNLVQSAFAAMSESGYALVRLPEPTEPEHQRPWRPEERAQSEQGDEFAPGECDGSYTCVGPNHIEGCFSADTEAQQRPANLPAVPEQAQPLRRWLDKFGQTWQDTPDGHSMEMLHDESGAPPPGSMILARAKVEHQNGPLTEVVEAPAGQDGQR